MYSGVHDKFHSNRDMPIGCGNSSAMSSLCVFMMNGCFGSDVPNGFCNISIICNWFCSNVDIANGWYSREV